MTESRTYVTENLWFPCETCGKQITHHTMHNCFVMNPDILPTLKKWQLVCTMVKQQQFEIKTLKVFNLTDEEILQVGNEIEPLKGSTMEQAFIYFARAILRKAQQK